MNCQRCQKPMTTAEAVAYRNRCEDCWGLDARYLLGDNALAINEGVAVSNQYGAPRPGAYRTFQRRGVRKA